MRNPLKRFALAQNGVAAIEFAFLLPLLALMLLGSVELQRYLRIERQLSLSASNIAAMVAQQQATDVETLIFDFNAAIHMFPASRAEAIWFQALLHQITNVAFTPTTAGCTQNCTYNANVAWVWPEYDMGFGLGNMRRQCGTLNGAAAGATPTGATIPASMFGPGSMVIVNLGYRFTPLFGSNFVPSIDLFRHGYANARFASSHIKITNESGAGSPIRCPGY